MNIYIYIHTYVFTYVYIYIYTPLSLSIATPRGQELNTAKSTKSFSKLKRTTKYEIESK